MMKKDSKISALEHLRIQKIRLQAESDTCLQTLDANLEYIRNHAGSLFMGSAFSAVKSKLPVAIQNLIPSQISFGRKDKSSLPEKQSTATYVDSIVDHALEAVPFFFKGLKPVVVVFVLKKLKEVLFKSKKSL